MDPFEQVRVAIEECPVDSGRAGQAGDGDVPAGRRSWGWSPGGPFRAEVLRRPDPGQAQGDDPAGAADDRDSFLDLEPVLVGEVFEVVADALDQATDPGDLLVRGPASESSGSSGMSCASRANSASRPCSG